VESGAKSIADRRLGWVPLDYTVEYDGNENRVELPFIVAIIADLSGIRETPAPRITDRKLIQVDVDNIDAVLHRSKAKVRLKIPDHLNENKKAPELEIELHFKNIDDFSPGNILRQIPQLDKLMNQRAQLASLAVHLEVRPKIAHEIKAWLQDPKSIEVLRALAFDIESEKGGTEAGGETVSLPQSFSNYVSTNSILTLSGKWRFNDEELSAVVNRSITELDERMSLQMNEILHHQAFQRLESTWRGIAYLAKQTESGSFLKLRILNATKEELIKDFAKFGEVDHVPLFKKLYEEEAYMIGGEPYGLILCDFEVSYDPKDIDLLRRMAQVASICQAPVLFGTDPGVFNMETWEELPRPRDLAKIFQTIDHASWRELRAEEDAAYVILVLPRLLAREPWDSQENVTEQGFAFVEDTSVKQNYLWMNGAFGLTAVITNAFARDRWCIDLRGPLWGRIEGLPAHYVVENNEIVAVIGPTEQDISDRRHTELEKLGFTSLSRHRRGNFAAVMTPRALAQPNIYDSEEAINMARLSIQLEHQLVIGRIRQVIRAYLRDCSSLFRDADSLTKHMQTWLDRFTVPNSEGEADTQEALLQAPFRSASVQARAAETGDDPIVEVKFELNYIPKGEPVSKGLIVYTPPGLISSRLVP